MSTPDHDAGPATEDRALAEFYEEHDDLGRVEIADTPADLGRRMTEAMALADHTTDDLAVHLGVPAATVAAWQAGDDTPSATMVNRVAGILGASLSWLLIGEGSEPREAPEPDDQQEMQTALDDAREALRLAEEQLDRVADRLSD